MVKKIFCIVMLITGLQLYAVTAQDQHLFREGLTVANCHQYGRQGFYSDQFAYRYFEPEFQVPGDGKVFYTDSLGREVVWKVIRADSSGIFRSRDARNGYLYLTYTSAKEQDVLVNISGNSMFYFNREPHAGDVYGDKWLYTPVRLKKGMNEIFIRTGNMNPGVSARIVFPESPIMIITEDATTPHIVSGADNVSLKGAVVVINGSSKPFRNGIMKSALGGKEVVTAIPVILPYCSRKILFRFDGSGVQEAGPVVCRLTMLSDGKKIAETSMDMECVSADKPYKCTFISEIDGSVQYFAVNPRKGTTKTPGSLYLSVHGAGVEAIGQARAYGSKEEGVLVAPTNRRPRGFNWEDWGRTDALEVLDIAVKKFNPDPRRIYLTGHSMGGHGTWYLGATFPGKWAAIAPCAGYPSLLGYASADGKIPQPGNNINEQNLYRASNGSNVSELAKNYAATAIYVFHGDDDRTVSVEYARQMRELLGKFHADFSYYEYPGGSHWWSNESVDWPPLFNFLENHRLVPDSLRNKIDFSTANPAVSSTQAWVSVLQQQEPLKYSRIRLIREKTSGTIQGETENISALKLDVKDMKTDIIAVQIDGDDLKLRKPERDSPIILIRQDHWSPGPAPDKRLKGILRNGTFKEPFNHRMVFVYGTTGTREENGWSLSKARFDAETWYYRGNGSVDIIADKEFDPAAYPGQGIILYGNATTNSAWNKLLAECPVQVSRNSIKMGDKLLTGEQYGAYLMYPRPDSQTACVAAITGTGLPGMRAAYANQYFTGGSGFPDYMIFTSGMVRDGVPGILHAGFYTNNWALE